MDSHFVFNISVLLSLCLIGGSVPDGFCQNVITSVLKGSNLDPTLSNNICLLQYHRPYQNCWDFILLMNVIIKVSLNASNVPGMCL